jgi:hypothetical protein
MRKKEEDIYGLIPTTIIIRYQQSSVFNREPSEFNKESKSHDMEIIRREEGDSSWVYR